MWILYWCSSLSNFLQLPRSRSSRICQLTLIVFDLHQFLHIFCQLYWRQSCLASCAWLFFRFFFTSLPFSTHVILCCRCFCGWHTEKKGCRLSTLAVAALHFKFPFTDNCFDCLHWFIYVVVYAVSHALAHSFSAHASPISLLFSNPLIPMVWGFGFAEFQYHSPIFFLHAFELHWNGFICTCKIFSAKSWRTQKCRQGIFCFGFSREIGFYIQYNQLIDSIVSVYIRSELKGQNATKSAASKICSNGTKSVEYEPWAFSFHSVMLFYIESFLAAE